MIDIVGLRLLSTSGRTLDVLWMWARYKYSSLLGVHHKVATPDDALKRRTLRAASAQTRKSIRNGDSCASQHVEHRTSTVDKQSAIAGYFISTPYFNGHSNIRGGAPSMIDIRWMTNTKDLNFLEIIGLLNKAIRNCFRVIPAAVFPYRSCCMSE